jgi:Tol biopolymer transport system component
MKRRDFLTTSAGLLGVMAFPGYYLIQNRKTTPVKYNFKDYRKDTSFGNVKIVTPGDGYYIHTFFDTCPFSPSQKYLAVTKFPFQKKEVEYGDLADVCVVDLENETIQKVYSTKGWGYQLGANLNWGASDRYLYTNDIIDNEAVCVRIDLETMETKAFAGPMYHIAPDESAVVGFPLDMINDTQMGYGVPYFKDFELKGAPSDQGLWQTRLKDNRKKLLVSLNDVYKHITDPEFFKGGTFYFFHTKFNLQGSRIFQVTRCLFPDYIVAKEPAKRGRHPILMVFDQDGSNIQETVTREQWDFGGNHPTWHPDGEHIVMNLTPVWLGENEIRFCMVHHSGNDMKVLSKKHLGTRGHNSVTPDTSYLLGDYYVREYKQLGYEECPIRLIDLNTEEEVHITKVFTDLDIDVSTFRVDPHPVWSRDYKKVCFNGAPGGNRQVFVADLSDSI